MSRVLVRMSAVLGLVALGCGPVPGDAVGSSQSAITWGQYDANGAYPHVGAMMVSVPGSGVFVICSGTLIDSRLFLTAGHCTSAYESYAAAGMVDGAYVSFDFDLSPANPSPTLYPVAQVLTHPEYAWILNDPHDAGLLVLDQPVTGITPAVLPPAGLLDQLLAAGKLRQGNHVAKFTVVGYGGSLTWPPPAISYEDKRQIAESAYQKLLKAQLLMSQNQALGNGGTCYGDSGGPAFYRDPAAADATEYLVGITSWGDMQCVASGFDYRVDIPQTLDFINATLSSL